MNTPLKCPSCNAQMELSFLTPRDKIARCGYCGTVVDLPDGPAPTGPDARATDRPGDVGGATKEETTEVEQEKVGDGYRVRTTVRVTKRTSTTQVVDEDSRDLLDQARRLLEDAGDQPLTWSSAKETRRKHVIVSPGADVDLPAEMRQVLAELRTDMPPFPNTGEEAERTTPATGAENEPRSESGTLPWWKRIFGRSRSRR